HGIDVCHSRRVYAQRRLPCILLRIAVALDPEPVIVPGPADAYQLELIPVPRWGYRVDREPAVEDVHLLDDLGIGYGSLRSIARQDHVEEHGDLDGSACEGRRGCR